jgi:hypothetical protein
MGRPNAVMGVCGASRAPHLAAYKNCVKFTGGAELNMVGHGGDSYAPPAGALLFAPPASGVIWAAAHQCAPSIFSIQFGILFYGFVFWFISLSMFLWFSSVCLAVFWTFFKFLKIVWRILINVQTQNFEQIIFYKCSNSKFVQN